jgi:2-polyprenyl-3-methyl-5-hydroxy-6-metoxy-1,4-benzoquinol methylase
VREVLEYRYLTAEDHHDATWENWSRAYEYPFVLTRLRRTRVMNVGCGGLMAIHGRWATMLNKTGLEVTHSDIVGAGLISPFTYYDLRKPWDGPSFDTVIAVSVLEHISYPVDALLDNLFGMVAHGGIMLATMDVPGVDRAAVDAWAGQAVTNIPPGGHILSGANSVCEQLGWAETNILALAVENRIDH